MRLRGDGKCRCAIFLWFLEEWARVENVVNLRVELFAFVRREVSREGFENRVRNDIGDETTRGEVAGELRGEIEIGDWGLETGALRSATDF